MSAALVAIVFGAVALGWSGARWAVSLPQIALYAITIARLRSISFPRAAWPLAAATAVGVLQLALDTTAYAFDTRMSLLFWIANLAAFTLAWNIPGERILTGILVTGSVIAVAGTVQLFTSPGRVFWLFDSGYQDLVIGPFVYRNQYAAFVELLLPMAVALGFFNPSLRLVCLLLAGFLYASVIASGSRAGSAFVTCELLIFGWIGLRNRWCGWKPVAAAALVSGAFVLVVGPESLLDRLRNQDEWGGRVEMATASVAMLRDRPWTGFGLGNWALAYPAYATFDDGLFANQAHSDWIEWAVEGGLPFALALVAFAAVAIPAAVRRVWGLGIPFFLLHCLVDYPSRRQGLALLFFTLAGLAIRRRASAARTQARWTPD